MLDYGCGLGALSQVSVPFFACLSHNLALSRHNLTSICSRRCLSFCAYGVICADFEVC